MTVTIYDDESFFKILENFHEKFKNFANIQDPDKLYHFTTNYEKVEFGDKFSFLLNKKIMKYLLLI